MKRNETIKKITLLFVLAFSLMQALNAQVVNVTDKSGIFYFDAILFKSDSAGKSRLDIYTLLPYASMTFIKSEDIFGSEYSMFIKIRDKNDNIIDKKTIERNITEKNYYTAEGGNADFDVTQSIFYLPPGNYEIEVIFFDKTGNRSYRRTRQQSVLDFSRYSFSLSGIMIVSSIEENKGKYIITPFLSDNIGILSEYFFIFFESYKNENTPGADIEKVDFLYEFVDDNNKVVLKSNRTRKSVHDAVNNHYLRVNIPTDLPQGSYMLRLYALRPADKEGFDKYDILATTERSIQNIKTVNGKFIDDVDKAIKQLQYIATQSEMDYMLAPDSKEDRRLRFEEFWRKHDPTPNTERNEAYEDYYSRIDYANRNFQSYTEGWRTDMGKVYVVYGPPLSTERRRLQDGRYYEKWIYGNKEIIFVDYNGFGNYRLYSPRNIIDKYEFNN